MDDKYWGVKRYKRYSDAFRFNEKLTIYRELIEQLREEALKRLKLANEINLVRLRYRKGKLPQLRTMTKAVRKLKHALKKVCFLTEPAEK